MGLLVSETFYSSLFFFSSSLFCWAFVRIEVMRMSDWRWMKIMNVLGCYNHFLLLQEHRLISFLRLPMLSWQSCIIYCFNLDLKRCLCLYYRIVGVLTKRMVLVSRCLTLLLVVMLPLSVGVTFNLECFYVIILTSNLLWLYVCWLKILLVSSSAWDTCQLYFKKKKKKVSKRRVQ